MSEIGFDRIDVPRGVTWNLHGETDLAYPQESIGNYVSHKKGIAISCEKPRADVHTNSTKRYNVEVIRVTPPYATPWRTGVSCSQMKGGTWMYAEVLQQYGKRRKRMIGNNSLLIKFK